VPGRRAFGAVLESAREEDSQFPNRSTRGARANSDERAIAAIGRRGRGRVLRRRRRRPALCQKLWHDAAATCPESATDGDLLAARGGAGEQQVGEIDAGDEKDDAYRGPEDDEQTVKAPTDVVLKRTEMRRPTAFISLCMHQILCHLIVSRTAGDRDRHHGTQILLF
jgi:hypothetical protein